MSDMTLEDTKTLRPLKLPLPKKPSHSHSQQNNETIELNAMQALNQHNEMWLPVICVREAATSLASRLSRS